MTEQSSGCQAGVPTPFLLGSSGWGRDAQGWRAGWAKANPQDHIPLLSARHFTWDHVYFTTKSKGKKRIAVEHLWINLACIINEPGNHPCPPTKNISLLLFNELGPREVSSVSFIYCGDSIGCDVHGCGAFEGNSANFPVHPGWEGTWWGWWGVNIFLPHQEPLFPVLMLSGRRGQRQVSGYASASLSFLSTPRNCL